MKARNLLLMVWCVSSSVALAQQGSKDDAEREKRFQEKTLALGQDTAKHYGWKHTLNFGANLTQVSFKDWVQGGDNALAYSLLLNGASVYDIEQFNWSNTYKLAFGQARLGSQGVRKTDDDIYFESLLVYKVGSTVNPYLSATMRTQFGVGNKYDNNGSATPVSKFWDPASLTQSAGMIYIPVPEVKTRLGLALREILTSQFNGYADNPATAAVEATRVEGGMESVTDVQWNFAENMNLSTRLELFAPFNALEKVQLRNDNMVIAKVNKFVNVSVGVQILNDVNVSPRTQIKQVLAIGFNYGIL